MPEGIAPDPGLITSAANWLSLPGQMVRNRLAGRDDAALRNLIDFAGDAVDSTLPGDLIPEFTREQDRLDTRGLLKEYGTDLPEGFAGDALSFIGDVATDPVTYLPPAWVAKGGSLAAQGVKAITPKVVQEGVAKVAKPIGKKIKKVFGAEKVGKPVANLVTRAQGAKDATGLAGHEAIVGALKGATPRELEAAQEVLANRTVKRDPTLGYQRALDESGTLSLQDRLAKYVAENPDVDPDRLAQIVTKTDDYFKTKFEVGKSSDIGGGIFKEVGTTPEVDVLSGYIPGTATSKGIRGYYPQVFKNTTDDELAQQLSNPNFLSERKLTTPAEVSAHLAKNLDVEAEGDLLSILARYNTQSAEQAGKGAFGQGLIEMARNANIALPDDILAKALEQQRMAQPAKAVVTGGDDAAKSVDEMLGGAAPEAQGDVFSSGPARDPYYTGDIPRMRAINEDLGGFAQSGKSVVGKSANAAETGMSAEQRQSAREWLLSKPYKQADPLMREAAEAIAKSLPGDEADVALHFMKGMEAREGLPKLLANVNRSFKPVAVYGAVIPKLGSITRNMTGGVWQKYSNPEARGTISPKNIIPFMRDWLASIDDGVERLFGKRIFTKNEFAEMDAAFKAGAGDPRKALGLIKDPTMRAAAERGIFGNNFIDTEQLIAQSQRTGLREAGARLWDYPGHMFKGAEQRMRYGLFKQLTTGKNAVSADDAARIVRDSFYDYTISSTDNRLARDIIPFFQFLGKSIPQQGKLMAEKPWLASTVANAYSQSRDEPVMPYMEGKINIPIGEDELGNRQYISNLGLPFESLSVLPNLSANPLQAGRDIEQSIVGSMSPLLKMPYSYISGRDPMFGSMPGSYTKVAGQDLGTAGGAINQLFSTGAGPAVAAQQLAGKVGQFTDERTSLGDLALNQLTGMRVQSVDEDRALQQRVQSLLERDPTIGQFRKFYSKDEDDTSADALLKALQNAKQSLKAKREALVPVN